MATTYPLLSCGTNITRYVWGLDISGQSGGRASSQAEMQGAGGVGGLCAVFPDNGITPHYGWPTRTDFEEANYKKPPNIPLLPKIKKG